MNVWDIAILVLIGTAVILALRQIRKRRGSCSCGCSSCAGAESCRKPESGRTCSCSAEVREGQVETDR